jgi:hypothetical protein
MKNGDDECYMKVEQAHAILLQNLGKQRFVRRRGVDGRILRHFLKEILYGNLDRIKLAQYRIQWWTSVYTLMNHWIVLNSGILMSCWTFLNSWNGSMPWIWWGDFAHGIMDICCCAGSRGMDRPTWPFSLPWHRVQKHRTKNEVGYDWMLSDCSRAVYLCLMWSALVNRTRCNHMTIDKRRTRNLKRVWNIQEMCLVCEEGEWKYESTVNSWRALIVFYLVSLNAWSTGK